MMRRRDLTAEELDNVIRLRQQHMTWLGIQRETGIPRRIAKRGYETWERSQSMHELKEARKDVAAQAFRQHVECIATLAQALVYNLNVPPSLDDMKLDSQQFFSSLWGQDLLSRAFAEVETEEARLGLPRPGLDQEAYRREQELLFSCLREHTRGEKVRWEALDRWEKSRDKGAKLVAQLRKEAHEVVENFVRQQEPRFLEEVEAASGREEPVKRIEQAVVEDLWQRILADKVEETTPRFEKAEDSPMICVQTTDGHTRVLGLTGDHKDLLAASVTEICESSSENLRRGPLVENLQREIRNMQKAGEALREDLNRVKLIPMVLRTRCDLCPA